jgi:hypothetical protein
MASQSDISLGPKGEYQSLEGDYQNASSLALANHRNVLAKDDSAGFDLSP